MEREDLEKLVEVEQRSKSNTKRIDNLENKVEDIHNLTLSVREIATEMKMMREDMNKIDKRVLAIEDKPSKKMDLIWGYIVSAIVSGLIVFIFMKLGMK
ncbi:MAG: hypothetical protein ACI31S_01785 [Bacilli bacterium]